MKRVLVIGSGGAGKSTFAAELARHTGLPIVHLDALYWNPGWIPSTPERWAAIVDRCLEGQAWIQDGNYGGTLTRRLHACDTVVFLDLPRAVCLWRVVWRRWQFRRTVRPGLPDGCPERLTGSFLWWVWRYPVDRRPGILRQLEALGPEQRAIRLRSASEVRNFLASLASDQEHVLRPEAKNRIGPH